MKKYMFLFLIVICCLVSTSIKAQDVKNRMWLVDEATVKSESMPILEESLKELAEACKEFKYPYTYLVCRTNKLGFYFFTQMENMAEYDKIIAARMDVVNKMNPESRKKFLSLFKSNLLFIVEDMPELSYTPEEPRFTSFDEFNYAIWDVAYVKYDKISEWQQKVKEIQDLISERSFNDPIVGLRGSLGTEYPMFAGVLYGKNKIDMEQQNNKMWKSLGEKGSTLYNQILPLIRDRESKEFWIRRDLSYTIE